MPSLKDVKLKIQGVKKTKQITKAMNMVATSRLRGAQGAMSGFRPYAEKFSEVLGSLAEKAGGDASSPLLTPKAEVKKIHIVLCTSDRGLCGGFNINLTDKAKHFIKDQPASDVEYSFTCFGKKGRDWCRKQSYPIADTHLGIVGSRFGFHVAATAGKKLVDSFLDGTYDEVYLLYSQFFSMGRQVPTLQKLLPIPPIESTDTAEKTGAEEKNGYLAEHICEPSPAELLGDLLPRNVYVQMFRGLLETSTSEHAARMSAMDNATKACNDMIDRLTLAYNKARQAAITSDLMDIVGGAEALRG
ncbi:ATP synthase F1 subunit gamma [Desulfosarcina sp. OttesenSCG-928-A07]|nr:ATP synthase F1 subunit gamma [Desulfosarcina sp. OttesenSCG-928-G17]MDL2329412.1 ATP synthase F1 subunit gamma [Desulfosarcina sp. OttesenSCG-928-A07]